MCTGTQQEEEWDPLTFLAKPEETEHLRHVQWLHAIRLVQKQVVAEILLTGCQRMSVKEDRREQVCLLPVYTYVGWGLSQWNLAPLQMIPSWSLYFKSLRTYIFSEIRVEIYGPHLLVPLVSEPDPQKNQEEGLGDRLGWKCTVRLECRRAYDWFIIACLCAFIGNTNHNPQLTSILQGDRK